MLWDPKIFLIYLSIFLSTIPVAPMMPGITSTFLFHILGHSIWRYYYWLQRSCGQGNVFTGVCHSFCSRGERGLPQCMLGYHPPAGRHPPRTRQTPRPGRPPQDQADTPGTRQTPPQTRQTPPDQADTPPRSRLQHTVYERPVCILLECILVLLLLLLYTVCVWAQEHTQGSIK